MATVRPQIGLLWAMFFTSVSPSKAARHVEYQDPMIHLQSHQDGDCIELSVILTFSIAAQW